MEISPTPPRAKRQRNRMKCQKCRKDHQKCTPEDRIWPAKCNRCLQLGCLCSENFLASEDRAVSAETSQSPSPLAFRSYPGAALPTIAPLDFGTPLQEEELYYDQHSSGGRGTKINLHKRSHAEYVHDVEAPMESMVEQVTPSGSQKADDYTLGMMCLNEATITLKLYLSMNIKTLSNTPNHSYMSSRTDIFLTVVKEQTKKALVLELTQAANHADGKLRLSERWVILTRACDMWNALDEDLHDEPNYILLLKNLEVVYRDSGSVFKQEEVLEKLAAVANKRNSRHDIHKKLADSHQRTSLMVASKARRFKSKAYGIDLNLDTPMPCLHQAIRANAFPTFKALLARNRDTNASLPHPEESISLAVNIETRDVFGRTAIFEAVLLPDRQFLTTLLQHGANVYARDCNGHTVLETAAWRGLLYHVEDLINAGAEVNPHLTLFSSSPLQAAIEGSHPPVVRLLLQHQADHIGRSYNNKDGLTLAREKDAFAVVDLLENAGQNAKLGCSTTSLDPAADDMTFETSPDSLGLNLANTSSHSVEMVSHSVDGTLGSIDLAPEPSLSQVVDHDTSHDCNIYNLGFSEFLTHDLQHIRCRRE